MSLNKNIGRLDQVLRGGIGILLIYLGFISGAISDPFASNIIGGIGVINIFVAMIRVCPLYSVVGINTCHVD